jgi:CheY-like chemotaxis protein
MLLSLISDVLDMSKIEAGQMMVEQAPFRLADVLENVAVALGVAVGEKDIELVVSPVPVGVAQILGDAMRLEQVLMNLSSNATNFTQAGSIQVRVEVLNSIQTSGMLRFSVKDTGIGIAPDLQSGIFAAFSQADTSTARRFGGTGLGLTICRQLVSLMGGEIGVISSPGEGSEFWFTLPLLRADEAYVSSPGMVALNVLIADDSDIALKAIADTAMGLGWHVSAVDSGAAALARVLERKRGLLPDVVLLDWKMPGMDGLATARLIRESVASHECPIVIMSTAQSLTSLAAQAGAELVDAVLHKPVTASGLYNATMEAQRRRSTAFGALQVWSHESAAALTGVRILVADDSDINRDVAKSILARQGAIVSLADDGQGAIDWLMAHVGEVDIVLMDVQMPSLDGIEATRRLRRMSQFKDLPIVALTAGAFKSQHDAALAAGMSHFVSKPFDIPSTVALIQRLCRPFGIAQTPAVVPSTKADLRPTSSTMDVAQGLKLWTSSANYQTYLRRFVSDYSAVAVELQTRLARGERNSAAALAHKLSGVAANLALTLTQQAAQELERILGTLDDPAQALAHLDHSIVATVAQINQYVLPAEEKEVVSDSAEMGQPALSTEQRLSLKENLAKLLTALDSDNAKTVKIQLATMTPLLPPAALAAILSSVEGYDFRGAEACVQQLASNYKMHIGSK